jgi:hypothetical protein
MTAAIILSYVVCLSLGAIIGLLSVGLCAAASDKAPASRLPRSHESSGFQNNSTSLIWKF